MHQEFSAEKIFVSAVLAAFVIRRLCQYDWLQKGTAKGAAIGAAGGGAVVGAIAGKKGKGAAIGAIGWWSGRRSSELMCGQAPGRTEKTNGRSNGWCCC